jgi:hypothetical protein
MKAICVTCGTQFPESGDAPAQCPICLDERQYIGSSGQQWTSMHDLRVTHRNRIFEEGPGVWGIVTEPKFGIGQRALLVPSDDGNILWDCVSLVDAETVRRVTELGGVAVMAISHPHYYSSMIDWSEAFGGVPVHLHEDDREYIQRPDPRIRFWRGESFALTGAATLYRLGGHFAGYEVLHQGRDLFTGDLPQVCPDLKHVSFMYSYPNLIPLSSASVQRIAKALEPLAFDRLYGAWTGFVIRDQAHAAVHRSAERYVRALETAR